MDHFGVTKFVISPEIFFINIMISAMKLGLTRNNQDSFLPYQKLWFREGMKRFAFLCTKHLHPQKS